MPTSYLALTIGPIVKTLSRTRKTRELWGASYLFSRIMREVICRLIREKAITKENILLPSPKLFTWDDCPPAWKGTDGLQGVETLGAGLFPDRLFVKLEEKEKENILEAAQEATDEVLKELASMIDDETDFSESSDSTSLNYLKHYYQICFLKKELDERDNVIYTLSPLLETLELQSNFPQKDPKWLENFLTKVNYSNRLINEAFSKRNRKAHPELEKPRRFGFDSLVEIAVREFGYLEDENARQKFQELLTTYLKKLDVLKDKNNKPIDDEFEEEKWLLGELSGSKQTGKTFRTYHKYVAVVQADGDNVGSILKKIGHNSKQLQTFSQKLTEFAAKASLMIHDYGGSCVYAGGDDLLFFAPVSMVEARKPDSPRGYHILHLLEKLDNSFKKVLSEYAKFRPGLSFGVSVTYYAFPMGEALELARSLLLSKAKKTEGKNAVALAIQKHSGSRFGGNWQFDSELYEHFKKMTLHNSDEGSEINILKNVTHTLRNQEALLGRIGSDPGRVHNFMVNSFNERIHLDSDGEIIDYLKWVGSLIPTVYGSTAAIGHVLPGETAAEKSINQLFGMLRTVSFIKGEEIVS